MTLNINLPKQLKIILKSLKTDGFLPLLVGGCVRDSILGIEPKDIDVEVIGCTIDELEVKLSHFGKIDLIGKAFGIIKFKTEEIEVDFSVPRKENKIGIGHKSFSVSLNKMTPKEAAERRDFTFNSLAFDPFKNEILDFFGGVKDINSKLIRHTSNKFKEDSLRILRAMQFQSRFGFSIDKETKSEMKSMSDEIKNLPIERISEEFMKWAIKGNHPELIFDFIKDAKLEWFLPELDILNSIEQDHIHHGEGNAAIHTQLCLKQIISICERENITGEDKAVLVFAVLLHDIGKATTTENIWVEKHNREVITSRNHEVVGANMAINLLQRIGIKHDLIVRIFPLVENHLAHISLFHIDNEKGKKSALLKLSRKLTPSNLNDLLLIIEADHFGRKLIDIDEEHKFFESRKNHILEIAGSLNVVTKENSNILMGRHLIEMGMIPGILFGHILRTAQDAQDNLEFTNVEEAKEWVIKNFKNDINVFKTSFSF